MNGNQFTHKNHILSYLFVVLCGRINNLKKHLSVDLGVSSFKMDFIHIFMLVIMFVINVAWSSDSNQKHNMADDRTKRLLLNDPDVVGQRLTNLERTIQDLRKVTVQQAQSISQLQGNLTREQNVISQLQVDLTLEKNVISQLQRDLSREQNFTSQLQAELNLMKGKRICK